MTLACTPLTTTQPSNGFAQTTPFTVTSASITPTAGGLLVAFVNADAGSGATTITMGDSASSITWTPLAAARVDSAWTTRVFLGTGATGASITVHATLTGATTSNCAFLIAQVTGQDTAGSNFGDANANFTATPAVALGSAPASSSGVLVACFSTGNTSGALTVPTGFTSLASFNAPGGGNNLDGVIVGYKIGSVSQTNTFSGGAIQLQHVAAVEIPLGASGPTAAGSISITGSASGVAPATAAGSITVTGSATGAAAPTASGAITVTGSATGKATLSAAGTISVTGTSAASAPVTAVGAISVTGTATAKAPVTAVGAITVNGAASLSQPGLTATGTITVTGSASATAKPTATGAITVAGTGLTFAPISPAGLISVAGQATTRALIQALGQIQVAGTAHTNTVIAMRFDFTNVKPAFGFQSGNPEFSFTTSPPTTGFQSGTPTFKEP